MSLFYTRSPKTILLLFRYNIITTKQANCFVRPMAIVTSTRIIAHTPDGFRPRTPSAVSANAQRARRTGTVVSCASLTTDTFARRNVIFVVLFTVFVVLFFSVYAFDVIKIVSSRVGHVLSRDGPPVRVAADVALVAGRGFCRRSVSNERFPTGARKR